MKLFLRGVAVIATGIIVLGAGTYVWASSTSSRSLARVLDAHVWDVPIPFPIPDPEIALLGLTPSEAEAEAHSRAIERGRHLVEARYACAECHGSDFGGG